MYNGRTSTAISNGLKALMIPSFATVSSIVGRVHHTTVPVVNSTFAPFLSPSVRWPSSRRKRK